MRINGSDNDDRVTSMRPSASRCTTRVASRRLASSRAVATQSSHGGARTVGGRIGPLAQHLREGAEPVQPTDVVVQPAPLGREHRGDQTTCGNAYAETSDKTRRLFNQAFFERIQVRDGHVAEWEFRPPFDTLFSRPRLEYGTLVELMPPDTNRMVRVQGPVLRIGRRKSATVGRSSAFSRW